MPAPIDAARPGWRLRLSRALLHPFAAPVAWLLLALPAGHLLAGAFTDSLGPNPAEALLRGTGDWTLRALWLTLAITPLRQLTGLAALARSRRWIGVAVFVYAALHFLAYAWLDMGFDPAAIGRDLGKRPFALVGFLALVLLLPLAATSFDRAIRALGGVRWRRLHRLVHPIAALALVHFLWMRASKGRYGEVAVYAAILAALWMLRWIKPRARTGTRSA